jgi:hypothetical protein
MISVRLSVRHRGTQWVDFHEALRYEILNKMCDTILVEIGQE